MLQCLIYSISSNPFLKVVGGALVHWLVRWTPDRTAHRSPGRRTVLCS